jgi:hypothetical protein
MPSSALVTQLFSSLMRVYRTFPPVAPTPPVVIGKVLCGGSGSLGLPNRIDCRTLVKSPAGF